MTAIGTPADSWELHNPGAENSSSFLCFPLMLIINKKEKEKRKKQRSTKIEVNLALAVISLPPFLNAFCKE